MTAAAARPAHTPGPCTAVLGPTEDWPSAKGWNIYEAAGAGRKIATIHGGFADADAGEIMDGADHAALIASAPTLATERDYWNERFEAMRAENARLAAVNAELRAALAEIAEGKGDYSRDPLTHASNVIDEAKSTARRTLADTAPDQPKEEPR